MRHEHLCHSSDDAPRPDRSGPCRALSEGFSSEQDFVDGLVGMTAKATSLQISNEKRVVGFAAKSALQYLFLFPCCVGQPGMPYTNVPSVHI